jgi:hypothetical protein
MCYLLVAPAEALSKIPGYSHTVTAMNNCPNLMAMQTDPTVVKTFFVPSNTVSSPALSPRTMHTQILTYMMDEA